MSCTYTAKKSRNSETSKRLEKMQWNKDRAKVDKTDEVRKTVMASMRNLAKLFIEFKKQLECVDETTEASLMFDRMHWALCCPKQSQMSRKRQ